MESMYSWVVDIPAVQPPTATHNPAWHQPTPLRTARNDPSFVVHLPTKPEPFDHDAPPPFYTAVSNLPVYSSCISPRADPPTQSMLLFKLGFLFPPLWILGSFYISHSIPLPLVPHRRQRIPGKLELCDDTLTRVREAEVKWGKRCLGALFLLVCVGLAVGVTIWGALKMTKRQR